MRLPGVLFAGVLTFAVNQEMKDTGMELWVSVPVGLMILIVRERGQCASWPVFKLTISMISPTTHRLQLGNSVWLFLRHRTVYNPMIDEEVSKLLAYPEDRNMVQMEHLLAEASRSNWAINPAEVKLTWKIGTGGFGVCASTASTRMRWRALNRSETLASVGSMEGYMEGHYGSHQTNARRCIQGFAVRLLS